MHVQVEDALKEIEGLRGGAIGIVKIGAGPAWLRRHLPAAISRSLADNPGIQVRVEGGFDDALLRSLRKGELDFAVAELPSDHRASDLSVLALTSDTLGVCCRAGHPLATGAPVAMHRLLDFPWIMPPRGTRAQRRLRALFVTSDLVAPEPVVETEFHGVPAADAPRVGRSHFHRLDHAPLSRGGGFGDAGCRGPLGHAAGGHHHAQK